MFAGFTNQTNGRNASLIRRGHAAPSASYWIGCVGRWLALFNEINPKNRDLAAPVEAAIKAARKRVRTKLPR